MVGALIAYSDSSSFHLLVSCEEKMASVLHLYGLPEEGLRDGSLEEVFVYIEVGYSGRRPFRAQLHAMCSALAAGGWSAVMYRLTTSTMMVDAGAKYFQSFGLQLGLHLNIHADPWFCRMLVVCSASSELSYLVEGALADDFFQQ